MGNAGCPDKLHQRVRRPRRAGGPGQLDHRGQALTVLEDAYRRCMATPRLRVRDLRARKVPAIDEFQTRPGGARAPVAPTRSSGGAVAGGQNATTWVGVPAGTGAPAANSDARTGDAAPAQKLQMAQLLSCNGTGWAGVPDAPTSARWQSVCKATSCASTGSVSGRANAGRSATASCATSASSTRPRPTREDRMRFIRR